MHFQGDVENWKEAMSLLVAGFYIKVVDRGDMARDAIAVNNGLKAVLRHWGPPQHHEGTWEEKKQRARDYFETFVDETFRNQYAQYIHAIQFYNEIWANSQGQTERDSWTMQDAAAAVVWNEEYRTQPEYAHIRLVLSSAAVGNDLPKAVAELAIAEDCWLAYHPYIAVFKPGSNTMSANMLGTEIPNRASFHDGDDLSWYQVPHDMDLSARNALVSTGGRSTGDWRYCSGRWHFMEQEWGLKPDWMFTEGGPCRDTTGNLTLDPLGGWKALWSSDEGMLDMLDQWMDDVRQTPAFNEDRVGGIHLFTTPGNSPWETFAFRQPELNRAAERLMSKWTPTDPPPPPPEPRTWDKYVILLPNDAAEEQYDAAQELAYPTKTEIAFSADSALARPSNVDEHTVDIFDVEAWGGEQAFLEWVNTYYSYDPPTILVFKSLAQLFTALAFDSPVGSRLERQSDELWPGDWVDALPFLQEYPLGYHTGADLNLNYPVWDMDRNMPVYASGSGYITYAGIPSTGWQGVVVIRHVLPDDRIRYTRYGHLGQLFVEGGNWVKRGTMLGLTGRNVTSDGPGPFHLHFEVSRTDILEQYPSYWPGFDYNAVVEHFVDPKQFIIAQR